MVFEGRVYKVLPMESGTSKSGNQWRKQKFVFEYFEHETDRYSDKVLLELWGERVDLNLQEGEPVRCGFGMSVREFEGKFFNEPKLYKIERLSGSYVGDGADRSNGSAGQVAGQVAGQQAQVAQAAGQEGGKADDLPF